jgi:hypothetical protein
MEYCSPTSSERSTISCLLIRVSRFSSQWLGAHNASRLDRWFIVHCSCTYRTIIRSRNFYAEAQVSVCAGRYCTYQLAIIVVCKSSSALAFGDQHLACASFNLGLVLITSGLSGLALKEYCCRALARCCTVDQMHDCSEMSRKEKELSCVVAWLMR